MVGDILNNLKLVKFSPYPLRQINKYSLYMLYIPSYYYYMLYIDCFRNGFPEDNISAVLHQIELSQKHQSGNFGLNLISVSRDSMVYPSLR